MVISHLRFRKQWQAKPGEELPIKAPFFPYLQILGIILIAAILITMGLDKDFWNISWIVGVPWLAFLTIIYYTKYKKMQITRNNELGEVNS
ncbi:hypothetical protein GC098_02925 [Paenibacillus sp. LMG 31458]|uniref:Amino acid permease/ SLC12A domain-containing protein n=1 Tax=Paenibacillus phytorum TaxID=2654977 RepID=A0ABX1XPE6_9BACL|nr:hypothetical protein [Paenibacillus phytorum]NOU70398.1 hypothetical protein [Paenibacillus phytorum]